jgi:hypothetical protein
LKSIGQQIKILERLQHISDGRTDKRTGAGDNKYNTAETLLLKLALNTNQSIKKIIPINHL